MGSSIPPHVDPRLVVDFDYMDPPGLAEHGDIYRAWGVLHAGPDIVWTPRHGGHWILTRAEDIKWAQETYEIFSHSEIGVPRGSGGVLPPATFDPPDNVPYRAALNPSFAKSRVQEVYEPAARALTVELVEKLRPSGRCEFVADFARIMPVRVFLGLADLPAERREEFLEWGAGLQREETRPAHQAKIVGYLAEVLAEQAERPGEDLLSHIAAFRRTRHFRSDEELLGMAMLVFAGGLDTVAAELSFAMRCLAVRPDLQRRLSDDPEVIPRAVEEFLRRHGLSNTARLVIRPCERKGAQFMPGDIAMVPIALSGMDERAYANPLEVDFDRAPAPHNTFGNGPHLCVGAHLARMEMRVFLEEWFGRMPPVRLDPERPPISHAGPVEGMTRLHLLWDA
jgi:cytochrome P450